MKKVLAKVAALSAAAVLAWSQPVLSQQATDALAPEAATGQQAKTSIRARQSIVVAANPLAAEAGLAVLRDGGSAADALVVVQTVLGLVEPQSSGIGGGAFLVWYDAASGTVTTFETSTFWLVPKAIPGAVAVT